MLAPAGRLVTGAGDMLIRLIDQARGRCLWKTSGL